MLTIRLKEFQSLALSLLTSGPGNKPAKRKKNQLDVLTRQQTRETQKKSAGPGRFQCVRLALAVHPTDDPIRPRGQVHLLLVALDQPRRCRGRGRGLVTWGNLGARRPRSSREVRISWYRLLFSAVCFRRVPSPKKKGKRGDLESVPKLSVSSPGAEHVDHLFGHQHSSGTGAFS